MKDPNIVIIVLIIIVFLVWVGFKIYKELDAAAHRHAASEADPDMLEKFAREVQEIRNRKHIKEANDWANKKKDPFYDKDFTKPASTATSPDPMLYPGGFDFGMFAYGMPLNNQADDNCTPPQGDQNDLNTNEGDQGSCDAGNGGND